MTSSQKVNSAGARAVVSRRPSGPGADKGGKQKELLKACQDFEAMFLSLIWKNMAKSTGIDLGGWSILAEEAMGKKWAWSGGIGLAEVLYRSMSKSSPENSPGDDGSGRTRDHSGT